MLKLFRCNLMTTLYLTGVKDNKQCWRKHVTSLCLFVKKDLYCPFHSPFLLCLTYDDEVQITQQYTCGLVIKHRTELSNLYFSIYKYGTVHGNFNMIKIRNDLQGCRVTNSVYGFDESVVDSKNDTYCEITSSSAMIHTALHILALYSIINKPLASSDDYYTLAIGEESRSCASEIFIPIDCTDTSTSQLTTSSMPITVLLEDTVCQLFSENALVFEDSQQRIFDYTEVTGYPIHK